MTFRLFKAGFAISILLYLLSNLSLAVNAEVLTFESVLGQAIEGSYDLRISEVDVEISNTGVMEARAEYFPQIRGRMNSEYQKDLSNDPSAVTTVGDTVLPAGTRFQNSVNLQATQTLFNFGIRRKRLQVAKNDVAIKEATYNRELRELKLRLLEHYTNALRTYQALRASREVLPLRQDIYQMTDRLFEAGQTSKVEVAEEAIQVAKAFSEQGNLKAQLHKHLKELSYYTGQSYSIDTTEISEFNDSALPEMIVLLEENSPEMAIYNLEIENKKKELAIQQREWLPQLTSYVYYNLFGADPDNWPRGVGDLQNRSLSLGIALNVPIFDGFKNLAEVNRTKLEIEKLQLEKEKALAELRKEFEATHLVALAYEEESEGRAEAAIHRADQVVMEERLQAQQLLDRITVVKQQIAMIEEQLSLSQAKAQQHSALQKLLFLSEGMEP